MQHTPFNHWFDTPYYHLLYAHRDEHEATAFIDRLINHLDPPLEATMIDIACGKGRHALQLAQKGFQVTGIDLSASSIEAARKLEQANLKFMVHDMRLPIQLDPVDYAFNFFTSFGYFETESEDQQAIASMARALKPGGWLIMDYLNLPLAENQLIPRSETESNGIQFISERKITKRFIEKNITVIDPSLSERLHFNERVARYRLTDFTRIFEAHGLSLETCLGNYALDPYNETNSPRLILIARKTKTAE
jgi:SAM-dependent methyltransferase